MSVAGAASLLPLHAARRRCGGRWRYFLEDWTVSHAPSPVVWLATRRRLAEPGRQGRCLLAITAGPGENPAVGAFGAGEVEELAGANAAPFAILRRLPQANYLSFYCHGRWNPLNPTLSVLLPTAAPGAHGGDWTDGATTGLTVADFRSVDLRRSRLAFLWACESAMIGLRSSFEAIGFPSAMIDAGVPGVIAALWIVEDEATRWLAHTAIREHLDRRVAPAAALKAAQIALITDRAADAGTGGERGARRPSGAVDTLGAIGVSGPATEPTGVVVPRTAPFFWAGFVMVGA